MTHLSNWMPWVWVTGMGLFASLTTGQVVGFAFNRKLPTFKLLSASFILAVMSWAIASLQVGAVFWVGNYFWTSEWADTTFGRAALGLLLGLQGFFLILLIWRLRIADGRRWATAGAVIPWTIASLTSAGSYHWFSTTDTLNYQVPEYFWTCVFFSMAIGIILGSCAGGMIYHQTKHLRSSKP